LNGCADRSAAEDSLAPTPDPADEVKAIVKNRGVAASDTLGETPASLCSKRTLLADYSAVHFVIHGLVADVKGIGAQPSKQPSEKACSPRAKSRSCSQRRRPPTHQRALRIEFFDCATQQF
jgi:hypothetical protein